MVAVSILVSVILAWFFYRSALGLIITLPVGILLFIYLLDRNDNRFKRKLREEFKECLLSVATNLRTGYALENAFVLSRDDLRFLFGEESLVLAEMDIIRRGLVINISIEELIGEMAIRCEIEDIYQLASIIKVAKRNGGDMVGIMNKSAEVITKKVETEEEIETLMGNRRMELYIMELMPLGVLIYVSLVYPGYFDPLFFNLNGVLIMTGCLFVYVASFFWGNRIMEKIKREVT